MLMREDGVNRFMKVMMMINMVILRDVGVR